MTAFEAQREAMVADQLRPHGIEDERVLAAMGAVPRELFVSGRRRRHAYDDGALPIGHGQTISQPWIVAAICQALALDGDETVLEVGGGSGYSAAVLARLAARVVSVERVPELAEEARRTLVGLGVENVEVVVADGSAGVPGRDPFDAFAVHAATPAVPAGLTEQLRPAGRLVLPLAESGADMLTVLVREGGGLALGHVIGPCRFVPLISGG